MMMSKTNTLIWILQCYFTEPTVPRVEFHSTRTHRSMIPSSYSFINTVCLAKKHQMSIFDRLWFDQADTHTHGLPQERRAFESLHHCCGYRREKKNTRQNAKRLNKTRNIIISYYLKCNYHSNLIIVYHFESTYPNDNTNNGWFKIGKLFLKRRS